MSNTDLENNILSPMLPERRSTTSLFWQFFFLCSCVLVSNPAGAEAPLAGTEAPLGGITTILNKSDQAIWTLDYNTSKPVEKITFIRNPDDSRVQRWQPLDDSFKVGMDDAEEYIARVDGARFSKVSVKLTPTYKHLTEDYAPFSPFSDGGSLIHSGRLFACENSCDDDLEEWQFELQIPENEHALINGELLRSGHRWIDKNDGMQIYVGKQRPILLNGFKLLIDRGLPEEIKTTLPRDLKTLFAYFESKLGQAQFKHAPVIFASYSNKPGTSVQGGVLPGQIYIHWDKDDLADSVQDEKFLNGLLWTFAHEAGHYFQNLSDQEIEAYESWIHEGHAELMAYDALLNIYPEAQRYADEKASRFKDQCAKYLKNTSLLNAASNNAFSAYYSCGFLIHQAISLYKMPDMPSAVSPYRLWRVFREKDASSDTSSEALFLETVSELVEPEMAAKVAAFVNRKHDTPSLEINRLFK